MPGSEPKISNNNVGAGRPPLDHAQNVHRVKKAIEIENKAYNIANKIVSSEVG